MNTSENHSKFIKLKLVARVKKQIAKFDLTKDELGFVNN
jgi:hypothetical protein